MTTTSANHKFRVALFCELSGRGGVGGNFAVGRSQFFFEEMPTASEMEQLLVIARRYAKAEGWGGSRPVSAVVRNADGEVVKTARASS